MFAPLIAVAALAAPPPELTVPWPDGPPARFRWVPPGHYVRGSPLDEPDRDPDEGPAHPVRITRGFYLGVHEVTQRQWQAVTGSNPARFQQPGADDPADRPVESVSWNDTQAFIDRLNGLGRGRFRLPTEAEWEYAARAGTTTPFPWPSAAPHYYEAHKAAWANSRSAATTHAVGTKPANPWGFHDLHGNVWEWCSDWYGPYPDGEQTDPAGPPKGAERVFRGGSWFDFPHSLRSANRHRHVPDQGYTAIGVRLVLEASPLPERTVTLPGGVAVRFAEVPAGAFDMGSPPAEPDRQKDEDPVHRVTISKPFWLGVYEVTQDQWRAVMGANPSVFAGAADSGSRPVDLVSWDDARQFLAKLNGLNLGTFRLPTEAEWEYAARSGTGTTFPHGDDPKYQELQKYGRYNFRSTGQSSPVGRQLPTPWGFYDLTGNVWEWCGDWYGPYPAGPVADPRGPASGDGRVIRGGSWFNEPGALRPANRHRHKPDSRLTNLGLRLVWAPGEPGP